MADAGAGSRSSLSSSSVDAAVLYVRHMSKGQEAHATSRVSTINIGLVYMLRLISKTFAGPDTFERSSEPVWAAEAMIPSAEEMSILQEGIRKNYAPGWPRRLPRAIARL